MYFSSMFPKDFNDILLNTFLIQNIEELDTLKVIRIDFFFRKAEKLRSKFLHKCIFGCCAIRETYF